MSNNVARHEMADRSFVGTPRPLPRLLFCHVPSRWCGRKWWVVTEQEFNLAVASREVHQELCASTKKDLT